MNTVVVFEDSSKADFGGGQQVSREMIDVLLDLKYKVCVIDFALKSRFQNSISHLKLPTEILSARNVPLKKNLYNSFSFSYLEILFNIFLIPPNLFRIYRFLKNDGINDLIIICTTKRAMLYMSIFKILNRRQKIVFYFHNVFKPKSKWRKIFRKISQLSDANWFVSKTALASLGPKNGEIIYNPIINLEEKSKVTLSPPKRKFTIGSASSLYLYKGIQNAISAFQDERLNDVEFHIYGQGPMLNYLLDLSKGRENIKFMGFQSNRGMIFESIDVLIVPSIDEESFSLVAFEAISWNVPIILSNNGAHLEFFDGNSALFVNPNNQEEIINSILKYKDNKDDLRSIHVKNAINRRKEFSLAKYSERIKDSLISIYEKNTSNI